MQEARPSLSTRNMKGTSARHIKIRLLKNSDKEETLKSIKRKKNTAHVEGIHINMIVICHRKQCKQEDRVTSLKH